MTNNKISPSYETIEIDALVTDPAYNSFGIGRVEGKRDELTYVWFDEVGTMIHYTPEQVSKLILID